MDERTVVPPSRTSDSGPEVSLRVMRGVPSAEELAALVTVLLAEESKPALTPVRSARSSWSNPARLLPRSPARRPLDHGPGAWRRALGPS